MWFRKKLSLLRNVFFCSVEEARIFPWSTPDEALYRIILSTKGCKRIYLNGIKVPKRTSYVSREYKDSACIKIRIFGVLNFRTLYIPINYSTDFVSLTIKLPLLSKNENLIDKEIKYKVSELKYKATKRYAVLDSKNIKTQEPKLHISKNKSLKALKLNKSFSLNKKHYQLNNPTNQPISWKN